MTTNCFWTVIPAEAGIQYDLTVPKQPCVYILASRRNGTLYVGVTSDLAKRITEHQTDVVDGFTKKYRVHRLLWYEAHDTMESVILREQQMKKWYRSWKLELIEHRNPQW
ncbi:MAG: GIY-YIG nuclease family protein [Elusimicrobia bacterium]|nr:GIY-YIG nuclease family protein [Elusimicrobiota bacterium]